MVVNSRAVVARPIVGAALAMACAGPGARETPLAEVEARAPSETAIVSSRLNVLESAVFNQEASGYYGVGVSRGHYLFITQSLGSFRTGYGPRAYVTRDDRTLNPEGTELAGEGQFPPGLTVAQPAVHTGTHWLAFVGEYLSVLDLEGNLVATHQLPFLGRAIVMGSERALIVGTPVGDNSGGCQQGLFLDEVGLPLGPAFDIAPGPTQLRGGAAFDGSHFVVEYSSMEGAFAVALSESGELGEAVQIATSPPGGASYGIATSVLSDGESFQLSYQWSYDDPPETPPGMHYRTASVDDALVLTVGEQQIDVATDPDVNKGIFVGGRYLFPGGTNTYAAADGTDPIQVSFSGTGVRLDENLHDLGKPALHFGLGPQPLGFSGSVFDGEHFVVEWDDPGRTSVRSAHIDTDGAMLGSSPSALEGANAATSGRWSASNGASILRLLGASAGATLTKSDGTVLPIDLSGLPLYASYNPAVATDGTDYLVAAANPNSILALVSSEGTVLGTKELLAIGPPNIAFDGSRWIVTTSSFSKLTVTPVAADLTASEATSLLTVPGDLGTWMSIASNGNGSLLTWVAHVDDQFQVYASRLSQDLVLLDAPGVLLGVSYAWEPPNVASDGTNYWVAWPNAVTSQVAVRRVAAEPLNGSILLDDAPFTPDDPPVNLTQLVGGHAGGVLLVENPYYAGPMRVRMLTEGDPTLRNVIGAEL